MSFAPAAPTVVPPSVADAIVIGAGPNGLLHARSPRLIAAGAGAVALATAAKVMAR